MRRLAVLALIAVSAAAGGAAASPGEDVRVRHGLGIGQLELGMRYTDVRRILGGPQAVNRRERLSRGRRYLELGWDFGWWTVGFIGRPGKLRRLSLRGAPSALGVQTSCSSRRLSSPSGFQAP